MLLGNNSPALPPSKWYFTNGFDVFSFLQVGLCAPPQQSITAGPSSNERAVSEPQKNQAIDVEEIED